MTKSKACLIIPVETKAREFDAKVYLAGAAVKKGMTVFLGEQNAILKNIGRLPAGIYFDKSVARPKVKQFQRLRKLGFRIVATCEEGLVYRSPSFYQHERLMPDSFNQVDRFYAWGKTQANLVRDFIPNADQKTLEVGNPRFDLLRPDRRGFYQAAADDIRQRHGHFVLINTNFARYNHYFGKEKLLDIMRIRGVISNPEEDAFFNNWSDFLGEVFHSFQEMVAGLSAGFPDVKFILRPHPSENHQPWRELAERLENVELCFEGAAIPWIAAADVTIHNSCTTGVEAALLGRPAIAYRKAISKTYDSYLPNRMSVNVFDIEDLTQHLKAILKGEYAAPFDQADVRQSVGEYIASVDSDEATAQIVEDLEKLFAQGTSPREERVEKLKDFVFQQAKGVARRMKHLVHSSKGYSHQKFPDFRASEIADTLARFNKLGASFDGIDVDPVCHGIARIRKRSSS